MRSFVIALLVLLVPSCHHGMVKEEQAVIVDSTCKKSIRHYYERGCEQSFRGVLVDEKMAVMICDYWMRETKKMGHGCHMAFLEVVACWGEIRKCGDCMQIFLSAILSCQATQSTD